MMRRDLAPFEDRVRIVLPDARGHGRSDRFEDPAEYTWDRKCADVVALLDHLGVERAVWGGNSMGAALSLWAGAHHPQRVRAIIDISGPPEATSADDASWWSENRSAVIAGDFAGIYEATVLRRSGAAALAALRARPERRQEVIDSLSRHSVASLLALFDETYNRPGWLASCAAITAPTLVIGGSLDTFPDEGQTRRVAAVIAGSELHVSEGAGHFPNRTHRPLTQSLIGEFLGRIGVLGELGGED